MGTLFKNMASAGEALGEFLGGCLHVLFCLREPETILWQGIAMHQPWMARVALFLGAQADRYAKLRFMTPLLEAAQARDRDICQLLLERGASPDCRNAAGRTPLHEAIALNDLATAATLIAGGADIDAQDDQDKTPLHIATKLKPAVPDTVLFLLGAGASSNIPENQTGYTPLHLAAGTPELTEAVRAMIVVGADINAEAKRNGETPLHDAICYGNPAAARALIEAGANLNSRDFRGRTPLFRACKYSGEKTVRLLLEHDADPNIASNKGHTPLMMATLNRRHKVISLLLWHGAKADAADKDGHTALDHLLTEKQVRIARDLRRAQERLGSSALRHGDIRRPHPPRPRGPSL